MCACVHVSMHVHVMHHVHVHVTMHCLQAFGDDFNLLSEISKNELIRSYVLGRFKKKSAYQTKMVPPAHTHMLNCAYCVSWLHVAHCMLYVACCMLHVTVACCMLHVACCMLYVACCRLHVACCMLHVVCCVLYVACCALHVTYSHGCCLYFCRLASTTASSAKSRNALLPTRQKRRSSSTSAP